MKAICGKEDVMVLALSLDVIRFIKDKFRDNLFIVMHNVRQDGNGGIYIHCFMRNRNTTKRVLMDESIP